MAQEVRAARATSMTRMWIGFSDKNWVGIGLKWVRFHFLKKSKLVKSSMFNGGFAFFELGSFSRFCVFKKRRLATGTDPPSPRLRRTGATAGQGLRPGEGRRWP